MKRNKSMCRQTKEALIRQFGTTCMLCEKDVGYKITHHHIIPHSEGGTDDYANGSLLCETCQQRIHRNSYATPEYTAMTIKIRSYKNKRS